MRARQLWQIATSIIVKQLTLFPVAKLARNLPSATIDLIYASYAVYVYLESNIGDAVVQ